MYTSKGCRVNKFMHYFLFGHIQLKFALGLQTWNYKGPVRPIGKESQVYRNDSKVHSPSHQFLPKNPVSCHLFESPHEFVSCFVDMWDAPKSNKPFQIGWSNRIWSDTAQTDQVRKLKTMFFTSILVRPFHRGYSSPRNGNPYRLKHEICSPIAGIQTGEVSLWVLQGSTHPNQSLRTWCEPGAVYGIGELGAERLADPTIGWEVSWKRTTRGTTLKHQPINNKRCVFLRQGFESFLESHVLMSPDPFSATPIFHWEFGG